MVLNNIDDLLEKYNNGETTLKEEQQLKDYFSQETVAPNLEVYKPMFNYFVVNKQEQFTKIVALKSKNNFNYKWLSVAAVAVLMFGFYFSNQQPNQDNLGTYQDPGLAYNEITKSLELVSESLNKGTSQVGYLNAIDKAGTEVGYLKAFSNPLTKIFNNN
jgi:hypothetical protein